MPSLCLYTIEHHIHPNFTSRTMANTFHHFNSLPFELRIQIWTLTLPPPYLFSERAPKIWSKLGWTTLDKPTLRRELRHYRSLNSIRGDLSLPSKRPIPAVLHVCHETRAEFLLDEKGNGVYIPVVFFGEVSRPAFLDVRRDALWTYPPGMTYQSFHARSLFISELYIFSACQCIVSY